MIEPQRHDRLGKSNIDNSYFDSIERSIKSLIPVGPFANDAAAAAGGVPKMGLYYTAVGIVQVRLT